MGVVEIVGEMGGEGIVGKLLYDYDGKGYVVEGYSENKVGIWVMIEEVLEDILAFGDELWCY